MKPIQPRSRAAGYLLVEMIVILAIMSVAMLVEVKVIRGSMQIIQAAPAAQRRLSSINHLTASLHRDVWSAVKIDVPEPASVVLSLPEGKTIRWHFEQSLVTRTEASPSEPSQPRQWNPGITLQAKLQDSGLLLESQGEFSTSQLFFSQMILAGGTP